MVGRNADPGAGRGGGWWATWLLWAACVLAVAGCAEVHYTLHLDPGARPGSAPLQWPAPPEVPRFRYVGQLLGEDNLVADDASQRALGRQLLRWVVGLWDGGEEKRSLKRPQSGTVDAQGRIYVTDISNHGVMVFDPQRGQVLAWEMAQPTRRFVTPVGIALGLGGQLLVADAELGEVFRLDRQGQPVGSFGKGVLQRPTGLARDPERGQIYVADTHAHNIKVFDDRGVWLRTLGQRGEDAEGLNYPTHLAFAQGRLYVADSMNARIQILDPQGRWLQTLGQRGVNVGDLTRPKGVTVEPDGLVYVVESYYDTVLVFNPAGELLLALGGTGKEAGKFYLPAGLWNDGHGRIFVADMFNGRVLIFQRLEAS